ncbi:MAG: hypothetical protein M1361_00290 [Patescibacteria group bacterium]|nr:hypothetical protein [Patescibacteria group bacterium]
MKKYKKLFPTAAILSATIFGAGMFSLPYVFSKAGLVVGFFYLAAFTALLATTHYLYSEVVRITPENHRFLGYAQIYLGRRGWLTAIFTTAIGILLTLTIFIILSSSFIGLIFPSFPPLYASLLFWVVASVPLLLRVGRIALMESAVVTTIVAIAIIIFIIGVSNPVQPIGSTVLFNWGFLLLPYGAVIFSLAGRAAISSLVQYAVEKDVDKKTVSKAVVVGTMIPAVVYGLFVIGAISLSKIVSQDAVSGLIQLPQFLLVLIGLLGTFSIWASYISISREIEGIFAYDFKASRDMSLAAVAFIPPILFILGLRDFIVLVGIIGGIFLALEHTMVTLMWQKMTSRRPLWSYLVIALLVCGALYEVVKLI